ncbi:MAG: hypothetical protein CMJ46_13690 [Planctomyces sp.]|nr:hypothetical protein [Planctomyces sp.]
MTISAYRFEFQPTVAFPAVEQTLLLALLGTESLFGHARVRMDAAYETDAEKRTCVIDASTDVGTYLIRLFTGYAVREFGDKAFAVKRVTAVKTAAVVAGN